MTLLAVLFLSAPPLTAGHRGWRAETNIGTASKTRGKLLGQGGGMALISGANCLVGVVVFHN